MTIQVLESTPQRVSWPNSKTVTVSHNTKKGDIVVIVVMASNASYAPSGFTRAGTLMTGMIIYYKEVASDGITSTSVTVTAGAMHSAVLRSTKGQINVIKAGDASVSDRIFNVGDSGSSSYILTATGNSHGLSYFSGWEKLFTNTGWGTNNDYYNAALKEFKNEDMIIPPHPYWGNTIESYMVLGEMNAVNVYVSTSDDGVSFSEYAKFNSSKIPNARYLKFKANIESLDAKEYTYSFEFDQSVGNKQKISEFLESVSANIKPVTLYKEAFEKEAVDSTKYYFNTTVNRDTFKKITALNIT